MNRIVSAIKYGFEDKALSILKDSDSSLSIRNYLKLINLTFEFGTAKILDWLINSSQHRFDLMNINWKSKFNDAVNKSHLEIVKLLLSDKRVDPCANKNFAIRCASQIGHTEVVKLLLQDKRVDPSDVNNYAIRHASQNGHTEVVKLLLQDKRVDPCDFNNFAIQSASENGHTEGVKLLLADKRVDPSAQYNCAIKYAIYNGNTKIVKLLKDAGYKLNP